MTSHVLRNDHHFIFFQNKFGHTYYDHWIVYTGDNRVVYSNNLIWKGPSTSQERGSFSIGWNVIDNNQASIEQTIQLLHDAIESARMALIL